MTEYFHDIAGKKVLCVHNCSPVFTQAQKDAGLVVVTREIYEYLLVQYGQAAELLQPTYRCYECGEMCHWLTPDSRCNKCTRMTPEEVSGAHSFEDMSTEEVWDELDKPGCLESLIDELQR